MTREAKEPTSAGWLVRAEPRLEPGIRSELSHSLRCQRAEQEERGLLSTGWFK